MKHLFMLAALMITFALSNINPLAAQSFVLEQAGENYSNMTMVSEDLELIFRKDRIEVINTASGNEDYFFILFKNVDLNLPTGSNQIKQETTTIENQAMAEVLGVSEMQKTHFETIDYKLSNASDSFTVTMSGNELVFQSDKQLPLELSFVGNAPITETDKQIVLNQFGHQFKIESTNQSIVKSETNDFQFKRSNISNESKLQFSITIN